MTNSNKTKIGKVTYRRLRHIETKQFVDYLYGQEGKMGEEWKEFPIF